MSCRRPTPTPIGASGDVVLGGPFAFCGLLHERNQTATGCLTEPGRFFTVCAIGSRARQLAEVG
jgi:hypothetical protein